MNELLKKYSSIAVLLALLLVSMGSMWISGKTNLASPKDIGMAIVSFFQEISSQSLTFMGNTVNSVQQLAALRSDYDKLTSKMQGIEAKQSDIEQLRSENERLKAVLQFTSALVYSNIPGQVIGKDPGVLFNTISINKGFNHGVRKGMPVIAVQGGVQGLVGKVMTVGPSTAQIMPVFDNQNYIAARLEKSRFEGLVNGSGSSVTDLRMTYIDPDAKNQISVQDLVITSGFNSVYPPNLIIGTVSSIQSKPYETSIEVNVHPFIDFSRLEYVYVLTYINEAAP